MSSARTFEVPVPNDAGERDNAVVGLHGHMIFKHDAVVVGRFGGVLDFAVGFRQGEQRDRAGKKDEQGRQVLKSPHFGRERVRNRTHATEIEN